MADLGLKELRLFVEVPGDHPEGEPLGLRIERNDRSPNVWAAPHNGVVYAKQDIARSAYEMSTPEYRSRQRARVEASQLLKANPVDADTYFGWVTLNGDGDDYFSDPQELLEWCHDVQEMEKPAYCWGTTEQPFRFDLIGHINDHICDNHHEDANDDLMDVEELSEFWDQWQAKQTVVSYFIDYKIVVVLDRALFAIAIKDAHAFLEASA
ncbi:MAG: hypothetical protein AAF234_16140 [Pseudomonadota bacterium]